MAAEKDGLAAARQGQDQIFDFAATDGIEPGSRLIKDHQIGVIDERLRQADAPLHAFGELAHRPQPGLAQTHHFQQLFRPVVAIMAGQAKEVAEEVQRLAGIEVAIKIRFLRQVADASLGRHVAGGVSEDFKVSFGGMEQTQNQLYGGGLAGAVGSQQAKDFSAPHIEINIVHGAGLGPAPEIFEDLGQAADGNHHLAGGWPRARVCYGRAHANYLGLRLPNRQLRRFTPFGAPAPDGCRARPVALVPARRVRAGNARAPRPCARGARC